MRYTQQLTVVLMSITIVLYAAACERLTGRRSAFADDNQSLQGTTWAVKAKTAGGRAVPDDETLNTEINFGKNDICIYDRIEAAAGIGEDRLPITINNNATPRQIDIKFDPQEIMYGIFERKGDSLKLCFASKRPTVFVSTQENKAVLIELRLKTQ